MRLLKDAYHRLFAPPQPPLTSARIIGWWELRRIPYNLILAGCGILSIIVFFLCISFSGELKPGDDAVEPMALILGLVLVPILANIFYTAGWIVNCSLRWFFSLEANLSPILLKLGIGFSIFIISLPAAIWAMVCLVGLAMHTIHLLSKAFS